MSSPRDCMGKIVQVGDRVSVVGPVYLLYSQPLRDATGEVVDVDHDVFHVRLDHPPGGYGMPGGHDHMVELCGHAIRRT